MHRLALAQLSMSAELDKNLAKALAAMEEAAGSGADIVVFPEIQLGPFFPQYQKYDAAPFVIDLNHWVIDKFCEACRRLEMIASPNVYLAEGGKLYDASVLIDRTGSILGVSKMIHITQAPGFYEQSYYAPSDEGFKVFQTDVGRIGIVICFDRHYAESFRSCVLQGADVILIPTVNMEGEPLEMFEWELRVAAFQNSVTIAMCNRVGSEGEATYCGQSIVVGPGGDVVMRADGREGLFYGDYDLERIADARRRNNYLKLYNPKVFRLER